MAKGLTTIHADDFVKANHFQRATPRSRHI